MARRLFEGPMYTGGPSAVIGHISADYLGNPLFDGYFSMGSNML
jgi:hypothetical protein